jgi:hypothetical protein
MDLYNVPIIIKINHFHSTTGVIMTQENPAYVDTIHQNNDVIYKNSNL